MFLGIDLRKRLRNPVFWGTLIPAIVLICRQFGVNIFPENYDTLLKAIISFLTVCGVFIDTSTQGISDSVQVPVPVSMPATAEQTTTVETTTETTTNIEEGGI